MLAICVASGAPKLPKGRSVLGRVAKTYQTVRGFYVEADVATQMVTGTGTPMNAHSMRDTIAVEYRAPDFFAVEHGNPRVTTVLPDRPANQYHPDFDQPLNLDGPPPDPAPPERQPFLKQRAIRLASLGFADYSAVEDGLTKAETLREEALDLERAPIACWVVEASYPDRTRRTFWVDMARGIVLREVRRSHQLVAGPGARANDLEVERTITVRKLRWNETGPATAEATPIESIRRPARNGVTPPVAVGLNGTSGTPQHPQCYEPAYTDEARIAGLSGVITMDFTIDEKGRPANIHPENRLGLGLDEMAAACLARWRYIPAQKDGQLVAVRSKATMNFHQRPRSDWRLERAAFHTADGAARPVFVKADYPLPDGERFCRVGVHLIVDENGVPRDIQIDQTADAKMAKEVMGIVSRWRFTPGQKDGRPAAVEADFELAHGADMIRVNGPVK